MNSRERGDEPSVASERKRRFERYRRAGFRAPRIRREQTSPRAESAIKHTSAARSIQAHGG